MDLSILTELRKGKGITQTDLAPKIGITKTYLSLLEKKKRKPSFAVVVDWCNALDHKLIAIPKT